VIILDASILLYAYDSTSSGHRRALNWLEQVLSSGTPVGLPWQTAGAFLKIVTSPALTGERFTPEEAARIIDQWLEQPNVRFLGPGENHWSTLRHMIVDGKATGAHIADAQLAALTIEYGGVLQTTDHQFSRFPGLRWINPLA